MVNGDVRYYLSPSSEKIKYTKFVEGTLDIYPDRLIFYKKSAVVNHAFGLVGSAMQGKGKEDLTVTANMIQSMELTKDNKGKFQSCTLYLTGSRRLIFSFTYVFMKDNINHAILEFLEGADPAKRQQSAKSYSEPPRQQSYEPPRQQSYETPRQEEPKRAAGSFAFCPYCGNKLNAGQIFCGYCGNQLGVAGQAQAGAQDREPVRKSEQELQNQLNEADRLMLAGKYEEEKSLLLSLPEAHQYTARVLVRIGRNCRNRGRLDAAFTFYEKALLQDIKDPLIYYELFRYYALKEQEGMSLPFIEKAIHMLDADRSLLDHSMRGRIYSSYALKVGNLGDMDAANNYIEKAGEEGYDQDTLQRLRDTLEAKNRQY